MAERTAKGCLVAAAIWIVILGVLSVAARYFILPYFDDQLARETGSGSAYKATVTVAADSFSGYAILRSPYLRDLLAKEGVRLQVQDDKGDVAARLQALAQGKAQLAVFTVDSFITSGMRAGAFPATMVAVVDETVGADALVSYKDRVPDIAALNSPAARIVLTPDSPSEFLARSVIARFNLPALPGGEKWMERRNGAEAVYRAFREARAQGDKQPLAGYVLWEPYVSLALQEPGAQVLIDSSRLRGHIVDVLAAERKFVSAQPELARQVLEAYFTAVNHYLSDPARLQALLMEDAREHGGQTLTPAQAARLAGGIEWKNTLQNYAAFGLRQEPAGRRFLLEDVIRNVTEVLLRTQALRQEPEADAPGTWFYARVLRSMQEGGFRPGTDGQAAAGATGELQALDEGEWGRLVVMGSMRVPPVNFARGTARLNVQSRRDLAALARTLESFPWCYLRVTGCTRPEGDREANRKLAQERAQAAVEELAGNGVSRNRLRAATIFSEGGEDAAAAGGQTVVFELLQKPF